MGVHQQTPTRAVWVWGQAVSNYGNTTAKINNPNSISRAQKYIPGKFSNKQNVPVHKKYAL